MLANDSTAVLAVLAIGCIWLAATAAERMDVPASVTIAGEAALIGMASALALDRDATRSSPSWPSRRSRPPCGEARVGALASLVIELVGFGVTVVHGHRRDLHPGRRPAW